MKIDFNWESYVHFDVILQLLEEASRQPDKGDFDDAQEYYNREKNRYQDRLPCKPWYNISSSTVR